MTSFSASLPVQGVRSRPTPGTGHVLVVTEHRFTRTPDGRYWSEGSGHWATWQRLLPAPHGSGPFAQITIAARVTETLTPPAGSQLVEGPCLAVAPLPGYLGPSGYLRAWVKLRRALAQLARDPQFDLMMLRQPGALGGQMASHLRAAGRTWVCEVVGDPTEVFAAGASRHPLRAFFAWQFARTQRAVVAAARGVVYVSEALRSRYPTPAIQGVASNVDLPTTAFRTPAAPPAPLTASTAPARSSGPWTIGLIGSLEQPYKGVDTAIEMLAILRQRLSLPVTLRVIGSGALQAEYAQLAQQRQVADAVEWMGALPAGDAVRQALTPCALYIQPSRTEGLPRALLEAMAWGLPAFGTPVGGIPEVLPPERCLPVGDADAWATAIAQDLQHGEARHAAAVAGHTHAERWHRDRLAAVRAMVYRPSLLHRGAPVPYTGVPRGATTSPVSPAASPSAPDASSAPASSASPAVPHDPQV